MRVELIEATIADKPVIRNLMQLYQYDCSDHTGEEPDAHGLFHYDYLDHYWTEGGREEGRIPFLVRRYPGRWQVGQGRQNLLAQKFWRAVIGEITHGDYAEVDSQPPGWDGPVQVFRPE